MDKKSVLHFLAHQKHLALIVGLGAAIIHLVITPMLEDGSIFDFEGLAWPVLITPTFMLDNLGDKINFLRPVADLFYSSNLFLFTLFSSFVWGIVAGFLASKKIYLRLVAVILVCLLIPFACFLGALAAQAFA